MSANILCENGIQKIIRGLPVVYDDGGRKAAGFRGMTGDCACRAISIATERPYKEIYHLINDVANYEKTKRGKIGFMVATGRGSHARTGVLAVTTRKVMAALGWDWTPTMKIGTGCKVHLRGGDLPAGRLVVSVSKHITAVVNGYVHDTYDPCRGGMRCVYGYWSKV